MSQQLITGILLYETTQFCKCELFWFSPNCALCLSFTITSLTSFLQFDVKNDVKIKKKKKKCQENSNNKMIDLFNKAQTRAWEVVLINPTDLAIKAWTPPMLQPLILTVSWIFLRKDVQAHEKATGPKTELIIFSIQTPPPSPLHA